MERLPDVVHHDGIGLQDHLVLRLLIGTHREYNCSGIDPLCLQETVPGLGNGDNRVHILGGGFGVVADDNLTGDRGGQILLELVGGGAVHVVDIQLVNAEHLRDRLCLGVALHPGAVEADIETLAALEQVLEGNRGLRACAKVCDVCAVHHGLECAKAGIGQQDHSADERQSGLLALTQNAAHPLDTGAVLVSDVGWHGVEEAIVGGIGG